MNSELLGEVKNSLQKQDMNNKVGAVLAKIP